MSFAATWLVAWEYDRLKPILFGKRNERTLNVPAQFISIPIFFAAGGGAMGFLWWMIRLGNFSNYLYIGALLAGFGFIFGLVFALHYRFMRVGELESADDTLR